MLVSVITFGTKTDLSLNVESSFGGALAALGTSRSSSRWPNLYLLYKAEYKPSYHVTPHHQANDDCLIDPMILPKVG